MVRLSFVPLIYLFILFICLPLNVHIMVAPATLSFAPSHVASAGECYPGRSSCIDSPKTCGEEKKKKNYFTCLTSHKPYLPDTYSRVPCAISLEKKPAFQALFHEASWELLKLTMSDSVECFKTNSPHQPWHDWGLAVQPHSQKNSGLCLHYSSKYLRHEYTSFVLRVSEGAVR